MSTSSPQAAPAAKAPEQEAHGFRRKMVGKVVRPNKKNKGGRMDKTVVVEVVSHTRDPLYGKYVRSRARYKAHDEKNEYKPGDEVEIQEHRPISRDKRFIVVRLLKKFVEE
ncbi:MAG TPA: 30S ribosomal protein S17 [Polyangiaceae bacterium]|nr:30S ribosomal protein S17 [Polyangiaceae bacterium]